MSLAAWQSRLTDHFAQLRAQRSSSAGPETPVFGLEHGLSEAELQVLGADVRAHIAKSAPAREHALPWTVYACEIGYQYSGEEFWETFERCTPMWTTYGARSWIRDCFLGFCRTFGGARPTGPWASHFSIICWPITHAILPRDLQDELARLLYYMRDSFSAEVFASPRTLGERIAARSWNATARFRNLAEEPRLVGQIAAALLLQTSETESGFVLPATLRRVVEDLERARGAREWLRSAQRVAEQRVRFRGLTSERPSREIAELAPEERARERVAALGIEPRLIARPTGPAAWELVLEIPDLSHLLDKLPALTSALTESRCRVAGSSGRPLARGALLHGPQHIILRTWPAANEVLLEFEHPLPPEFTFLLRAECLLRPGPQWLFRIASDGLGYELRKNLVRPGRSYLLIDTTGPGKRGLGVTPITLGCTGVHGLRLDLPDAIPSEWAANLENLGLTRARSVRLWPSGLGAAQWDGDGRAEWLTTERACVAIQTDYPAERLTLTLGPPALPPSERLEVRAPIPGAPLFVELPPLAAGTHRLEVTAHSTATDEGRAGELLLVVREPRAWAPGGPTVGALRLYVDPARPTLEQLWEGRVSVHVRGPRGRHVTATLSFFRKGSALPSYRQKLPPLPLPVDSTSWWSHFERHFRPQAARFYDQAHECHVDFNAETLGCASVRCGREFVPLRWIVRAVENGYELSVADERGTHDPFLVSRYDFGAPDLEVALDPAPFGKGGRAPGTGGLFVVRFGEYERALIVPPRAALAPSELGVEVRLRERSRSVVEIGDLLRILRLWWGARHTSTALAVLRRRSIQRALQEQIFALLGGAQWGRAEASLRTEEAIGALRTLKLAVSDSPADAAFAATISLNVAALSRAGHSERCARFLSIARAYSLLDTSAASASLGELALRLASAPQTILAADGLEALFAAPMLARGARFLVLAIDHNLQLPVDASNLHAGWDWS